MEGTDSSTAGYCYKKRKMLRSDEENSLMVVDPSDDPLSVRNLTKDLDLRKFGSVSKYMNELREKKRKVLDARYAINAVQSEKVPTATALAPITLINLDSDDDDNDGSSAADKQFAPSEQLVCSSDHFIVNLEDEDEISETPLCSNRGVELKKPVDNQLQDEDYVETQISRGEAYDDGEEGLYIGTEDDLEIDDGSNAADKQFAPSEPLVFSPVHVFVNLEDEDEISEKPLFSNNGVELKKLVGNQLQKDDYVETQIPRGEAYDDMEEGRYIGTEDDMEIYEEDRQRDTYSDCAWNETTAALECSKGPDYVETQSSPGEAYNAGEEEQGSDEDENVNTEDDMESEEDDIQSSAHSDCLTGVWNEMAVALECSKDFSMNPLSETEAVTKSDCEHLFILRDDIGEVCRICGIVGRSIESIIEYNFSKGKRSTQTYRYETHKNGDDVGGYTDGLKLSDTDFPVADMYPHPRHKRKMKPHQIEGFNFLASNLVAENPGGCIMAHAPGSGKTFMIISFLQSFMAKYPSARPLVVLPRGILETWKKEFLMWQVEDVPLYDLYSVKADSRSQQLQVLTNWAKTRSVLFLGYKQFSSIVCDHRTSKAAMSCQEILLRCPTILILDEGHTPRNQETDILTSLESVQTPRKVVLSGTLYQNHVKEVFNILNLVRPRFLKLEASRTIKKRILSRGEILSTRKLLSTESEFYDLIEHTMLKDDNFTRKVNVIQDLREMTRNVLHYYKGDNLDELPGLVDFSVFLQLSPKQQADVQELRNLGQRFKIMAEASSIYVHPRLKNFSKSSPKNSLAKDRIDEEKADSILKKYDIREGVKAKFYLNLLNLCESLGEKLLVFSQYLLPLKFLERLSAKEKGYRLDEEMFMITGDSNTITREASMEKFNNSPNSRVFFGSIKACGEGISLVGASRIIILDVHLNPSVTRQAIGRAFRPGQTRKVYTYRLVASSSPEEDDHKTCFKKESIAKMWFEWDELNERRNFEMESVDVKDCGDLLLEADQMNEDVVAVFKR